MIMSRRNMLAGTAAGGIATATVARAANLGNPDTPAQGPAAIKGDPHSGSDPGPRNPALAQEFPSSVMPPSTDHDNVENFWFPFAQANRRVQDGGWSREVTVRELPIATTLADQAGRSFVEDVTAGDLWNFPSGIPHSIQGLEPDGTEFLLVFDDGAFTEFSTFLPTQWMAHTPVDVLSKNFGVPASAFDPIPTHELYIFQAKPPGPLDAARQAAKGPQGFTPESFSFQLLKQKPNFSSPAGEVRIADQSNFPIASTIAAAHVIVHPGAMREMHWHPNADEWKY